MRSRPRGACFGLYAGGYYDSASGMLKFGTHYYMSTLARWTQRHPEMASLANPMQLNAYGYVGGDPINLIDPGGLHCGPGSLGDDYVPDNAGWYDFSTNCRQYDSCYAEGGGFFDKVDCDVSFLGETGGLAVLAPV